MNTFFSVLILFSFLALFIYLMLKIVTKIMGTSPSANLPVYNDTPSVEANAEFNKIRSSQGSGLRNCGKALQSQTLRNLVIKSSYNTAFTGSYMNLNMIEHVLSRGCRFLDFQVFVKDNIVVVGYSNAVNDPSFTSMTSLNCLSLQGVCETIMSSAFSDPSPNKDDPLFVQFHLKTSKTTHYDTVAEVLNTMKDRLAINTSTNLPKTVSPDTQLSDIMGKVVILMDAPLISTYTPSTNTQVNLSQVVNMYTGTPTVPIYMESELMNQMYTPSSDTSYLFRIVQPTLGFFMGVTNPDARILIQYYSVQIIGQAFYVMDTNLKAYEQLFKDSQSAFLTMSDTIGKISKSKSV